MSQFGKGLRRLEKVADFSQILLKILVDERERERERESGLDFGRRRGHDELS
jgi:hypothetical protein